MFYGNDINTVVVDVVAKNVACGFKRDDDIVEAWQVFNRLADERMFFQHGNSAFDCFHCTLCGISVVREDELPKPLQVVDRGG